MYDNWSISDFQYDIYTVFTLFTYEGVYSYTVFTVVFTVFTHEGIYAFTLMQLTPIHAKNIGEQKIGEEHSAKNVPAKNMTRKNVRNPTFLVYSLIHVLLQYTRTSSAFLFVIIRVTENSK